MSDIIKNKTNSYFMLIILLLVFLFAIFNSLDLLNSPLLVHIRTGEWMLENGKFLSKDIFSFEFQDKEWHNFYGLSQIIYALIYLKLGIGAVCVFTAFKIALTFSFLFYYLKYKKINIFLNFIFLILSIYLTLPQWIAVPYTFNFLFIVIFIIITDKYYNENSKYIYILPFLQILWSNINTEFFYSYIIIIAYIIGNKFEIKEKELKNNKRNKLFYLLLILIIVTMINPYTFKIFGSVFGYYFVVVRERSNEWKSPDFHLFAKIINNYISFLLFMILCFSKNIKKIPKQYILLFLISVLSFLYAQIHLSLFVIISSMFVPLFLEFDYLEKIKFISKISKKLKYFSEVLLDKKENIYLNLVVVSIFFLLFTFQSLKYNEIYNEEISRWRRSSGAEYIKKNKINEKGFHLAELGDMLIWYNYPETKVFIDSRQGVYSWDYMNDYGKLALIKPEFEDVIKKYDIKWIFIPYGSYSNIIDQMSDKWKKVYFEGANVIYLRKDYYEEIKDKIEISVYR